MNDTERHLQLMDLRKLRWYEQFHDGIIAANTAKLQELEDGATDDDWRSQVYGEEIAAGHRKAISLSTKLLNQVRTELVRRGETAA